MKTRFLALALACACTCGLAAAQEQAFTNRATELKERAAPEAQTLATLPENTPVKVVRRAGGWTQVDTGAQAGWLRVFHLRFPAVAQASESSGGALGSLGSALGFGRPRAQATTTATTGIRGLSPEELKNASPDEQALRQLQSYRADRSAAERFAREGKLSEADVGMEAAR